MEVLRTAIMDFCRRRKEQDFFLTEVLQQLFPQDWEQFLPEIWEVAQQLAKEGMIEFTSTDAAFFNDPALNLKVRKSQSSEPK